ncbi:hypothetical protein SMNM65_07600 [Streptococcus mitis]|uniref:Bacterial Ig domain-containing protein n=1 Tax=Streptococcus mitis TaxID=28037 RepID=A0A7G1ISF7_STRMT|nr:hypothetical protein SMNM65_07600 [Streptococcus mitis]
MSVKAEPGSTVKLYDKDNHEIGTGTAGDDGVATITVANNIPVGDVTAKATDASGNVSDPSAPKGATDTTKPNAPEITSDLTGKANTNSPVTVSVKAEPGSTVKLYDKDNHEIGTGTAGDDGVATITVANNIPVGDVTAKATDASGNVSDPSAPKGATDTTKPNAPEITSDLTGKANTNSPVTVSVKAEPGSTVKLYDKDNHEIGTGTAGDDGVATITVANNIPVGDVTAKATDASGNVSDPSAPKGATDTTKPNAPEITSDLTGKANTNSPVTVSVKAEPGSTVKLYDKDNHEIGTGTAGDDGVATITVANNIPVGDVTAKATDASGNVSDPSAPKGATDTTKPNAPEITSDLTGKANTNSPVTVSVKAEPGSTVKLYDKDNHEIGTGTAGDDGVATITVANNIPVGDVTAKATDASGNVSDPSAPKGATDTTKPNAPEITSDLTGKANTNSPVTVSVKAEPGSTVKLYDKDNHEIGTGTAGDDGVATITVANNIPVGDVTAKATDASGNVSDPSAPKGATDTTKPNAPEITSDLTGKANTNSPVTVSVKAEPGSTVKLYDKDNHEIGTGTAGDDGVATITVANNIPVGDVTAKATDASGNVSDPSAPKGATDTTKPNAPEITSDLTGKANTNSPVTVSVKAEPGSTVKLYDKDNHEIGTGTAGDDGVATITVANNIPVGDVTAKATDASGNVSDPSAPKGATDTTKPNAPEITSDLTGKANTNSPVTVSVKAEPGSTVKLYDKDNHEIGTGTAGDDGVATITVANNIPVGDVTAKATDASGNVSDPSAPKGATDTTKPNAPEITSDLTGKANTNSPVTVSVKAEPGSTVKLYDKDNHEIGTGTAGDDGVATITVANNIPVGDVTAKATDASGNVSDPSAPKGATDTTKPNAPEITSDLTGKANTNSPVTVSVKAEPGSTVKLYDKDNHEIGTGTAGDDG